MASKVDKRQVHVERHAQEKRRSLRQQRQQLTAKRPLVAAMPPHAVAPISPTAGSTMLLLPSPIPAKRPNAIKLQAQHCTWAACVAGCYRSFGGTSDSSSITVHQTFLNDLCARERISARLKRLTGKSSHELLLNSTSRTSNLTHKNSFKSANRANNNNNNNNNAGLCVGAASTQQQKQSRQIVRPEPPNGFYTKLSQHSPPNREQKLANDIIVNIDHATHKRYALDKCLPPSSTSTALTPTTSPPSKPSLLLSLNAKPVGRVAAAVHPKRHITMNIADDESVNNAFVQDLLSGILAFAVGPTS